MAVKPMPMFRILVRPERTFGLPAIRPLYWKVRVFNWSNWYQSYEIALANGLKVQRKYIRECSAYSKLVRISVNLLSISELKFIEKLNKTKCLGITNDQYRYISGIYERQEREF